MMKWTNRHFRYFIRLMSKHTILWTEMVVGDTLVHNLDNLPLSLDPFLDYNNIEHPIVCQLGGNNPEILGKSAEICTKYYNYDGNKINKILLNFL